MSFLMSESYTPADLLQKVDAIRCNVEGILKVIHPMKYAQQEVERLRQKYGDEFKLVDLECLLCWEERQQVTWGFRYVTNYPYISIFSPNQGGLKTLQDGQSSV